MAGNHGGTKRHQRFRFERGGNEPMKTLSMEFVVPVAVSALVRGARQSSAGLYFARASLCEGTSEFFKASVWWASAIEDIKRTLVSRKLWQKSMGCKNERVRTLCSRLRGHFNRVALSRCWVISLSRRTATLFILRRRLAITVRLITTFQNNGKNDKERSARRQFAESRPRLHRHSIVTVST